MSIHFADNAWLPHGWAENVRIDVDAGCLRGVIENTDRDKDEYLGRYVLPGMPNLHSHAFQRAMAGLAERRRHSTALVPERGDQKAPIPGRTFQSEDSFWTWRETMYAFAGSIGPEELRAIAAQL